MNPPLCRVGGAVSPQNRHGASFSLRSPGRSSGTIVYVCVCLCMYPPIPTGRPYPSASQAGLKGLACICRCVGPRGVVSPKSPMGRSFPPAAQTGPEVLGRIRCCVVGVEGHGANIVRKRYGHLHSWGKTHLPQQWPAAGRHPLLWGPGLGQIRSENCTNATGMPFAATNSLTDTPCSGAPPGTCGPQTVLKPRTTS